VLRTALKPRWLGLLAGVVLVMVSFTFLGLWQLNVARDKGRAEALRTAPMLPVAPIAQVLQPHTPFPHGATGRRITATGTYAGASQLLVTGRRLRGTTGYWVLTPLRLVESQAVLPVVRGFVTSPTAPAPPTGPVTVTGSLAPGEGPAESPPSTPNQIGSVDLSIVVNRVPGELYNAFAFAIAEDPASPASMAGLQRVPPPALDHGLAWRNAAYAFQWWIFALFAAFMWVRMVRDDARADARPYARGSAGGEAERGSAASPAAAASADTPLHSNPKEMCHE
jgi:surfeit locus 1 family protein